MLLADLVTEVSNACEKASNVLLASVSILARLVTQLVKRYELARVTKRLVIQLVKEYHRIGARRARAVA